MADKVDPMQFAGIINWNAGKPTEILLLDSMCNNIVKPILKSL
jgi:hypothetical protein